MVNLFRRHFCKENRHLRAVRCSTLFAQCESAPVIMPSRFYLCPQYRRYAFANNQCYRRSVHYIFSRTLFLPLFYFHIEAFGCYPPFCVLLSAWNSLSLSVGCFFHSFHSTFLCGHAYVCVSMSVCMHVASKCMCTSLDWLSSARERGNDITYNEEKQIKLYVGFNALDIAWLFLCWASSS